MEQDGANLAIICDISKETAVNGKRLDKMKKSLRNEILPEFNVS